MIGFMNACRLLSGVALIAFSCAAHAQEEQTVAGAQEFLGKVFSQGASKLNIDTGKGWNRVDAAEVERCMWVDEYGGFFAGMQRIWRCTGRTGPFLLSDDESVMWVDIGSWMPNDATAEGACNTRIQVNQKGSQVREFKARYDGKQAQFTAWSGTQGGPFIIDWTKVTGASNNGREVHLKDVSPNMYFVLPSEDLAVRVAYAMEFLRTNCDATAGTGF